MIILSIDFLLYFHFLWKQNIVLLKIFWFAFIISIIIPVDISLKNYPGHPRFVRNVVGLPDETCLEMAKRGEVMLAGCEYHGNDARWVLVW
jgi:hypothetical protein